MQFSTSISTDRVTVQRSTITLVLIIPIYNIAYALISHELTNLFAPKSPSTIRKNTK